MYKWGPRRDCWHIVHRLCEAMKAPFALTFASFVFYSLALQLPVQRRAVSISNGFSASVKSAAVNSSDNSGNVGIINSDDRLVRS